jgi:hypothetical protein
LEKFGHFFEFIAAANSAYIASEDFGTTVATKVKSPLVDLQNDFSLIEKLNANNHNRFFEQINKLTPKEQSTLKEVINKLSIELNGMQSKIQDFQYRLRKAIKAAIISNNFNYLCLFSCLYSILVLILFGFDYDFHNDTDRVTFLWYNSISIAIMSWIILRPKKTSFCQIHFSPSHINTLKGFAIPLLIAPNYYWLSGFSLFSLLNPSGLYYLNVVLAITIPTYHFFYYLVKYFTFSKRVALNMRKEKQELKTECEKFADKLNTSFDIFGNLNIQ